jgi:GH15 family glucan-1,4-alpha-glucosidase
MVLALTPLFLDARFRDQVTPPVLDVVTRLARKAISVAGSADAGIWEHRSEWRPRTFSSLMCWAAADRMSRIARVHRSHDADEFTSAAARIREGILREGIHCDRECLVADYGGKELDAALLQAVTLHFLNRDDKRLHATVRAVRADLEHRGWLRRYRTDDGFGVPSVAFTLCTFWLIEALAMLDRGDEARALMEGVRAVNAPLGLLSEDVDPESGRMWGNFPQAYSHVGLIHAAFAASPRWSEYGS